jgi:dynein heavy chain
MWRCVSYPSLKPLASYMTDLTRRLAFLSDWDAHGPPASFCLPYFFFPHSFLTAGLQNFARRRKLPIDVVAYDFEPLAATAGGPVAADCGGGSGGGGGASDGGGSGQQEHQLPAQPPPEGVYVHGLWLEGAAWDAANRQLAEAAPKVLNAPAPVIWFRPRPAAEIGDEGRYACPLYRTAERRGVLATTGHSTNFVGLVRLKSGGKPAAHWVARGAALIAQLSD